MKVLIYGFKPYKNFKENITEKIIKNLSCSKNIKKAVFPVVFDRSMFLDEIRHHKPDVIIGMGQHSRCKKIRIERRAINTKDSNATKILDGKPKFAFVNLKLKADNNSTISYNAGSYVCNFSMYVVSNYSNDRGIKFAFLHIPKDYDIGKATEFVESKITGIKL